MNNAIFNFPLPANEPVKTYLPGSPERIALDAELKRQSSEVIDIPLIIGGKEIRTGNVGTVVMPHNHKHILATYHKAGEKEVQMAVDAAMGSKGFHYAEDCGIAGREISSCPECRHYARTK